MLERLAEKNGSSVRIIKVNAVKNRAWASKENVRGVPAFRFYSGGMLVDQFAGAYPEKIIQGKIDKYATVFTSSASASASASQEKGKDGEVGNTPKEPTVQPMSKSWMPSGVTRE